MTHKDLKTDLRNEWAWSQVEAMADGGLDKAETERMSKAMADDPDLRRAYDRARSVRDALRRHRLPATPRGLLSRLLAVASRDRPNFSFLSVSVGALAVAFIAAVLINVSYQQAAEEQAEAMREFTIAMTYLNRSADYTRVTVRDRVSTELVEALAASRDSLAEVDISRDQNGG